MVTDFIRQSGMHNKATGMQMCASTLTIAAVFPAIALLGSGTESTTQTLRLMFRYVLTASFLICAGSVQVIPIPFEADLRQILHGHITDSNTLFLNPGVYLRSFVNFGDSSRFASALQKLQGRQCLQVTALGGSVTCGASLSPHDDAPRGVEDAWPAVLATFLNNDYPCQDSGFTEHKVSNLCQGGRSSDVWIDLILARDLQLHAQLANSDIVVVETAVNDIEELLERYPAAGTSVPPVRHKTEILLNQLLWAAPHAALIWLGTSHRGHAWSGDSNQSRGDAVKDHLVVTKHYNIPHVSAVDGLGPFTDEKQQDWFHNVFRTDGCCHLTRVGQRIVSHLVLKLIHLHLLTLSSHMSQAWERQAFNVPRPLYLDAEHSKLYRESGTLHASFNDETGLSACVANKGWAILEDKQGKPGLIAYNVTDQVSFMFPADNVKQNVVHGELHIRLLKSYEHMGIIAVTLSAVDTDGSGCNIGVVGRPITETFIDCLWGSRTSVTSVEQLTFNASLLQDSCLAVNFLVSEASPPRSENKIKLMGFLLF